MGNADYSELALILRRTRRSGRACELHLLGYNHTHCDLRLMRVICHLHTDGGNMSDLTPRLKTLASRMEAIWGRL